MLCKKGVARINDISRDELAQLKAELKALQYKVDLLERQLGTPAILPTTPPLSSSRRRMLKRLLTLGLATGATFTMLNRPEAAKAYLDVGVGGMSLKGDLSVTGTLTAISGVATDSATNATGVTGQGSVGVEGFGTLYGVIARRSIFNSDPGIPLLLIGPTTGSGAPNTGRHVAGEFFVDGNGALFYCYITNNSGGIWKQLAP